MAPRFWRARGPGFSFALSAGLHAAWVGAVFGLAGIGSRADLVVASGEEGVPIVVAPLPYEEALVEASEDAPPDPEEPRRPDLPDLPDVPSAAAPLEFPPIAMASSVEIAHIETRPDSPVRRRRPAIPPPLQEGTSGDRTPEALGLERPDYPAMAVRRGYEGTVVLRIEVLPDGTVGRVEVAATSGFSVLDRAALQKARTWRLTPATFAGRPVRSEVEIRVRFDLRDG